MGLNLEMAGKEVKYLYGSPTESQDIGNGHEIWSYKKAGHKIVIGLQRQKVQMIGCEDEGVGNCSGFPEVPVTKSGTSESELLAQLGEPDQSSLSDSGIKSFVYRKTAPYIVLKLTQSKIIAVATMAE